jgi:hypothetical protein
MFKGENMKHHLLLLLAFVFVAGVLSAQATNLLISEYVEGTSYQKAIEIFNGTGLPVDLSTVSLKKQTNGAGAFGNELVLSGTLANNDVFVIVNSTSGGTNLVGQPFVDLATTSQAVNFNGNDAVGLFRNGNMIDVVGIVDDPNIWGQDMTLVRNANIASPSTTFDLADWTQYPVNTFEYLGMHTFTGGTTDPVIIVTYPNSAVNWYLGYTYTITWTSANIEGNINIGIMNGDEMTIIEGSDTNDGSYNFTIPANYTTGNQFRIRVGAVNGAAADTSDTYFTIMELPVNDVATVADLRAGTPDGTTIYRVTGSSILTYQQTYRFKKYFQDDSAGIEIDDPDGIVTSVYQIGDEVSGLIGTLSLYNNLLQFTPFANFPAATSSGNTATIPPVTIAELNSNFENYESRLVQINAVSFVDPGTFATGTAYTISDATGQIVFRTNFFEADYIDQPIPSFEMNMLAITTQYIDTYQVTARSLSDFYPLANQDFENQSVPVTLIGSYPNPFTQSTRISYSVKSPQVVTIDIYNIKGQLVKTLEANDNQSGLNDLVWDSRDKSGDQVSAGVYMFKLRSGRFTSSKKAILLK